MQKVFKNLRKGFTLIELLIVIVIIGVLATAVLSAINPIEQINKARDAGRRSDAAELLNALERFYSAYEDYPWDAMNEADPGSANVPPAPGVDPGQVVDSQSWLGTSGDGVSSVIGTDELKPEFSGRNTLVDLFLWVDAGNQLVRICYESESKQNQARSNFGPDGEVLAGGGWQCVPE